MKVNPQFVTALERLNPSEPARPEWYVERRSAAMLKVVALAQANRKVRALLHGNIGVGKTTELNMAEELLSESLTVLRVNVGAGSLPEAFHEAVRTAILNWAHTSSADLTVAKVIRTEFRHVSADRITVTRVPSANFVWEVLKDIADATGRPVILVVDGLDLRSADELVGILGPNSVLADPELPAVVYTMPNYVLGLLPDSLRDHRFQPVDHIAPFPVVHPDLSANYDAIDVLADGLRRRLHGLEILQNAEIDLRRVAWQSGGVPRDAVRILQAAVLAGLQATHLNAWHLQEGARELRQDLEQGLRPDDVAILQRVRETRTHQGAGHLIAQNAILPYDGPEHRYWLPHPLLWPLLDATSTTA